MSVMKKQLKKKIRNCGALNAERPDTELLRVFNVLSAVHSVVTVFKALIGVRF